MERPSPEQISLVLGRIRIVIGNACRNYNIDNMIDSNSITALHSSTNNLRRIQEYVSEDTFLMLSDSMSNILSLVNNNREKDEQYAAERLCLGKSAN